MNLASEDPNIRGRSIGCAIDELTRANRLGVESLVLHPGTHADEQRGLTLIAQAIDEIHAATPRFQARVCLESTAGRGNCLGWRFEHLAEILQRVGNPRRLSVCLDTCHLVAAGYDLSTESGYHRVMEECDRVLGLSWVTCFHLNDCVKGLGCRVDRHAEIGKGTLGLTAFRCLVNDPRFADAIGVLETPVPEHDTAALKKLRSLRGKQPGSRRSPASASAARVNGRRLT